MTDKTTTDAELNTILRTHWPAFARQSALVEIWVRDALQDAIDKLGPPDQKTVTVAPATGDMWLKHDDDLRYVRRVLEAGRQMTDVDQGAAIDMVQALRVTSAINGSCDAKKPAQAADSVPAVEREQERIAFKDAHRHLELYEVPDAWGRPMFKHSHVEATWLGWIARASHGQAPASVLHLVNSAFAEIAMAFPKAFALHKVGIADKAVLEALAAPAPPPECETEAEKRAFAFGWFKALESERMKADNKKKGPL